MFGPVSFSLRAGEIVGLYGIIGAGRSELAETLFGLAPADAGKIRIEGQLVSIRSAARALAAGIAMLPEDRHARGLVPMLSVAENLSLSALHQFTTAGFIKQRRGASRRSKTPESATGQSQSPSAGSRSLSGGNQQKVVLGRSLMPNPRILILDEPTRGIDVVAKAEVHGVIDRLARKAWRCS